jgi:hypothetical protein
MSVPSRRDCAALLLSLEPPAWHLRHSRAVAETAAWLAWRAHQAGRSLDRRLVEAAALLHDVDKLPALRQQTAGRRHAEGSARWLARQGFAELGPAVAAHPVTRLADGAWFERWFAAATPEELIVAYADKRAGQRLETMAERFASWQRRYPPAVRTGRARGAWSAQTEAAAWDRARAIEARVCGLAGVAPERVRRLRWTGRALRAARLAAAAKAAPQQLASA